jgi:hypothetical protein
MRLLAVPGRLDVPPAAEENPVAGIERVRHRPAVEPRRTKGTPPASATGR